MAVGVDEQLEQAVGLADDLRPGMAAIFATSFFAIRTLRPDLRAWVSSMPTIDSGGVMKVVFGTATRSLRRRVPWPITAPHTMRLSSSEM